MNFPYLYIRRCVLFHIPLRPLLIPALAIGLEVWSEMLDNTDDAVFFQEPIFARSMNTLLCVTF